MQRILWVGVAVLAGLGVWLVTSSWQADPGTGDEASIRAASSPGSDPSVPGRTAGSNAANPARESDPASPHAASRDGSPAGSSASASRAGADGTDVAHGDDSGVRGAFARPSADSENPANVGSADVRGAQADPDLYGSGAAGSNDAVRPRPSGFDDAAPSGSDAASDPIADEVVIDYLARRSLGDDPTAEELSERRGWAATLLSGESQEVRDRLKAQASEAAAPQ